MKCVEAFWDEKISGLKQCEIIFDRSDTFKEYLDAQIENIFNFSVVKVPVGNLALVHKLEEYGYRYLENQLVLSFFTSQLDHINSIWNRLFEGHSYKRITSRNELARITEEVNDNMFEADRYSQDPFWTEDLSSKRYVNWINELFEQETVDFYIMIRCGVEIGFFSIKRESHNMNSCPIAGIFNKHKSKGYIFILVRDILLISKDAGAKKFFTSISSNNRDLLSTFSKIFNYRIDETYIVLRKIIS